MKPFCEEALLRFVEAIKTLLHPSLYERTFQEVGVSLGRAVVSQMPPVKDATSSLLNHYLHYGEWMRTHWGWNQTMSVGPGHQVEVHCALCPFDKLAKEDSLICQVEAAILGELAGELFGYGKVVIQRDQNYPPRHCRFVVHTERTPQSLAAEGLTFLSKHNGEKRKSDDAAATRVLAQLTPRERQIIALLAEGLSDKQIAEALTLSVRTVEGHLSRIREKTALQSRSALIRFALRASAI